METKTNVGISAYAIMKNDKIIDSFPFGTTYKQVTNKIDSIERERKKVRP